MTRVAGNDLDMGWKAQLDGHWAVTLLVEYKIEALFSCLQALLYHIANGMDQVTFLYKLNKDNVV